MILSELITEIRKLYPHSISADEMVLLRESDEICTILKETVSLRNVPLSLLKTAEETTSFLINLTNLMFLHALIFKSNGEYLLKNINKNKVSRITCQEDSPLQIFY